ncbi:hypothetical protein HAX54_034459 [Datura stramonium]|uniref:Phospholipid scramblase n=1 Tax=Datura stramonium TaxID=4076 RepID=A0ABS8SE69_DATST|nr:hypothetical protein [Datura stramonium]
MSWRKSFRCLAKQYKCRSSESSVSNEHWNGIFVVKNSSVQSQSQRSYLSSSLSQTGNLSKALTFEGNMSGRAKLPGFVTGIAQGAGPGTGVVSRQYGQMSEMSGLILCLVLSRKQICSYGCLLPTIGFIREQSNLLARQFLRTRRPFVAYVRRPFWWINSSIYAEINERLVLSTEDGISGREFMICTWGKKKVGEVESRMYRRSELDIKGIIWKTCDGKVLAQIDRDWRGFGFEIFTDAGQYVIRLGDADSSICPVTGLKSWM